MLVAAQPSLRNPAFWLALPAGLGEVASRGQQCADPAPRRPVLPIFNLSRGAARALAHAARPCAASKNSLSLG
jgi:hypothetical protein